MEERKDEELKAMYAMYARVDGLKVLLASFKKYIKVLSYPIILH